MDEPPFGRGLGPMPHPALLEEMREAQFQRGPRPLPPHPAIFEERLAAQHQEIQGLLVDNQRLAATHVTLKQELEAAHHELQPMAHFAGSMQAEKDIQLREAYEKSINMEADLRAAEAMRAELLQRGNQDLARANSELQQVPAVKAEIEHIKQELQRARAAIEYEKKGHAENYEQGQAMEKNLIGMAREVEKLCAEIANWEKIARAAAAVGNPGICCFDCSRERMTKMLVYGRHINITNLLCIGPGYGGNYGNPNTAFGGNPYPAGYGMSPAGAEGGYGPGSQFGPGPGPGAWVAYDMQWAHGLVISSFCLPATGCLGYYLVDTQGKFSAPNLLLYFYNVLTLTPGDRSIRLKLLAYRISELH
ncbi:hypothetical protein NE237_002467 [Protea cynaroides]|uniref:Uncharacterized protein n=1 Tax=Protea cynaroides TaxID=273540 RepID=A0A9Q0KW48_9MAGN|nr:hypothetical protein NE237_002467 [Protea cynaroides]